MPVTSQHLPMSYEEWLRLPYQPGWKYEYVDGCTHITPTYQMAVAQVAVTPRPVTAPCTVRSVLAADESGLWPVYMQAFAENQEFCDYTEAKFRRATRSDLAESFRGQRRLLTASRVALDMRGATPQPIGAALLSRDEGYGPVLDLLFVLPAWHQLGVATALVAEVSNALAQDGEQRLTSCYHLANVASQKWHQGFGFEELPDLNCARAYLLQAERELDRYEPSGDTSTEACTRLMAEVVHCRELVETMEQVDNTGGFWAAFPRLPHF